MTRKQVQQRPSALSWMSTALVLALCVSLVVATPARGSRRNTQDRIEVIRPRPANNAGLIPFDPLNRDGSTNGEDIDPNPYLTPPPSPEDVGHNMEDIARQFNGRRRRNSPRLAINPRTGQLEANTDGRHGRRVSRNRSDQRNGGNARGSNSSNNSNNASRRSSRNSNSNGSNNSAEPAETSEKSKVLEAKRRSKMKTMRSRSGPPSQREASSSSSVVPVIQADLASDSEISDISDFESDDELEENGEDRKIAFRNIFKSLLKSGKTVADFYSSKYEDNDVVDDDEFDPLGGSSSLPFTKIERSPSRVSEIDSMSYRLAKNNNGGVFIKVDPPLVGGILKNSIINPQSLDLPQIDKSTLIDKYTYLNEIAGFIDSQSDISSYFVKPDAIAAGVSHKRGDTKRKPHSGPFYVLVYKNIRNVPGSPIRMIRDMQPSKYLMRPINTVSNIIDSLRGTGWSLKTLDSCILITGISSKDTHPSNVDARILMDTNCFAHREYTDETYQNQMSFLGSYLPINKPRAYIEAKHSNVARLDNVQLTPQSSASSTNGDEEQQQQQQQQTPSRRRTSSLFSLRVPSTYSNPGSRQSSRNGTPLLMPSMSQNGRLQMSQMDIDEFSLDSTNSYNDGNEANVVVLNPLEIRHGSISSGEASSDPNERGHMHLENTDLPEWTMDLAFDDIKFSLLSNNFSSRDPSNMVAMRHKDFQNSILNNVPFFRSTHNLKSFGDIIKFIAKLKSFGYFYPIQDLDNIKQFAYERKIESENSGIMLDTIKSRGNISSDRRSLNENAVEFADDFEDSSLANEEPLSNTRNGAARRRSSNRSRRRLSSVRASLNDEDDNMEVYDPIAIARQMEYEEQQQQQQQEMNANSNSVIDDTKEQLLYTFKVASNNLGSILDNKVYFKGATVEYVKLEQELIWALTKKYIQLRKLLPCVKFLDSERRNMDDGQFDAEKSSVLKHISNIVSNGKATEVEFNFIKDSLTQKFNLEQFAGHDIWERYYIKEKSQKKETDDNAVSQSSNFSASSGTQGSKKGKKRKGQQMSHRSENDEERDADMIDFNASNVYSPMLTGGLSHKELSCPTLLSYSQRDIRLDLAKSDFTAYNYIRIIPLFDLHYSNVLVSRLRKTLKDKEHMFKVVMIPINRDEIEYVKHTYHQVHHPNRPYVHTPMGSSWDSAPGSAPMPIVGPHHGHNHNGPSVFYQKKVARLRPVLVVGLKTIQRFDSNYMKNLLSIIHNYNNNGLLYLSHGHKNATTIEVSNSVMPLDYIFPYKSAEFDYQMMERIGWIYHNSERLDMGCEEFDSRSIRSVYSKSESCSNDVSAGYRSNYGKSTDSCLLGLEYLRVMFLMSKSKDRDDDIFKHLQIAPPSTNEKALLDTSLFVKSPENRVTIESINHRRDKTAIKSIKKLMTDFTNLYGTPYESFKVRPMSGNEDNCPICLDDYADSTDFVNSRMDESDADKLTEIVSGEDEGRHSHDKLTRNKKKKEVLVAIPHGCAHEFHIECLREWYRDKDTESCPMCRRNARDNIRLAFDYQTY